MRVYMRPCKHTSTEITNVLGLYLALALRRLLNRSLLFYLLLHSLLHSILYLLLHLLLLLLHWRVCLLFCVCRGRKLVAAFQPHPVQLLINLLLPSLPLFDLGKPFAQLSEFLLDGRLLAFGTDALELPLITMLTLAESKGKGVVTLERCTSRNRDERCRTSV